MLARNLGRGENKRMKYTKIEKKSFYFRFSVRIFQLGVYGRLCNLKI
ncbi:hypothetical protein CAEBREN_29034 [Caenorhabditis brenneri]|uniref:Uncharacterized protein n=1 Tax=Caenorhabditis brenneri TaxID=135651 RepID=G0P9D3_CAEBE|nr:hypothetical protein CAEBREN_29034 [Caenorhabditis brenneri]